MIRLPSSPRRRAPLRPTFALVGVTTLLAAPFVMGACSSGSGGAGAGGAGASGTTSSSTGSKAATTGVSTGAGGSGSGGAGGSMVCPPGMTYGGGEASVAGTKSVKATIVDETGAPVVGQPVYLCGINICPNPGITGANGGASIQTNDTETKPAFKFGDAISYAELAIPLTMAATDFTTGGAVLATGKLAGKPGATLTPGADAISGDVTVSVPAGASVGINTLVYDTADQEKLRTVNIPLTNEGPLLDPVQVGDAGAGFSLLYGLAPAETTLCPAAKVTVALSHQTMMPNDLGWAPGTAVEFWIMTTDVGQTYAPYAGWAKMSDGVVSADGMSVATVDGQGFIFLENFAIRKAD
jgi:hypothetical protein